MNINAMKTELNLRNYLEKERQALYGMYLGLVPGGFCQAILHDRPYHIDYIIDESVHRFFVDVYPHIICEKPYRHMMHAYVSEKASKYKAGRIVVDSHTGEVRIRVETSILELPVSSMVIQDMEHLAICICETLVKRLEKMAHGVYFEEDDPELMGVGERLKRELSGSSNQQERRSSFEDFMKMLDSCISEGMKGVDDDVHDDFIDDSDIDQGGDERTSAETSDFSDVIPHTLFSDGKKTYQ